MNLPVTPRIATLPMTLRAVILFAVVTEHRQLVLLSPLLLIEEFNQE